MAVATFPKRVQALTIGDLIRAERTANPGHSQEYAASMTGYTRSIWSLWERNECEPSLGAIRAILGLYPGLRVKLFAALTPQGNAQSIMQ